MSSNRPPQLHLELLPSTTSFKRSFEEFGVDLESPLGGIEAGGSGSDGNDRNKRARSASSFSDDEGSVRSSSSSTIASSSSSSNVEEGDMRGLSALTATRPAAALATPIFSLSVARAPLEPPRLPTPQLQDIDMTDYPLVNPHGPEEQTPSSPTAPTIPSVILQNDDNYRLSIERFNAFDSQIAALRRSPSPSLRSRTPPPVLPPLALLNDDQPQLTTDAIPFLHPPSQPPTPSIGMFYDFSLSRPRSRMTHEGRQHIPRAPSHESETQMEASTSARENVLNQIPQEAGAPRPNNPWGLWHPDIDEEHEDRVFVEEDEEDDQDEDDRAYFPRADPIPVIGELRSPSPLFEDLDDLEEPPRPSTRRTVVPPAPPRLPPIEETWDDPLDSLRTYSLGPPVTSSGPLDRSTQSERISQNTSSHNHENDHPTSVAAGSGHNASTALSPLTPDVARWTNTENSQSTISSRSLPVSNEDFALAPEPATENPSNSNANNATGRMTRLEALHGLREALQGIGRVLQESERTLRPQLFNDSMPTNTNNSSSPSPNRNYLGDAWRSGFAEGFASALSDPNVSNASATTEDGRDSRPPRPSVPSRPTSEGETRPWFPEGPNLERLPSPPSRSGQLSEEYMHILRRDNEAETRHPLQSVVTSRERSGEGDRLSRIQASEGPWLAFSSNSWMAADHPPRSYSGPSVFSRGDVRTGSIVASDIPPVLPSGSSRPWPWEGNPQAETERYPSSAPIPQIPTSLPPPPTLISEFTSLTSRRPRLQGHSYSQNNGPTSNPTSSNVPYAQNSESSSRPHPPLTVDTGLFGIRQVSASNPGPLPASSSGPVSHAPATLSRFRSRLTTLEPQTSAPSLSHSIPESRLVATESSLEALRRTARIELMGRRSRGSLRQEAPEPSPRGPEPRPWESQNRFPPASFASRFLPEPRRTFHRRERDLQSNASQSLLDFDGFSGEFPDGPLEFRMDLDQDTSHTNRPLQRSATDSRMNTLGSLRRDSASDSDDRPRLMLPRRRNPGTNLRSTSIAINDATVDSLRQAHQNAVRTFPAYDGPDSQGELRDYLASPPLPSPSLGDFDFAFFNDEDRPRRPITTFNPSRTSFREPIIRRRSPSPPANRETTAPSLAQSSPARPSASTAGLAGGAIDPNAYAPGPFRNTMQRIYEAHVARGNRVSSIRGQQQANQSPPAPVIPPLAFDNTFSTLYDPPQQDSGTSRRSRPDRPIRHNPDRFRALADTFVSDDSEDDEDAWMTVRNVNRRAQPPASRPSNDNTSPDDSSRRFLNYLSGMTRFEESRLETSETPQEGPAARAQEGRIGNAIQAIRHDRTNLPRSQEIVNRFRRERERAASETRNASPTNSSSYTPWGYIERGNANPRREPSFEEFPWVRHGQELLSSQYAGSGPRQEQLLGQDPERTRLLTAHNRARRPRRNQENIFTSTSNRSDFMRALGRRAGVLGDYMRDEDFDTSYEGLLSLAATIGEVKPRATPENVIAKMETGFFKDWKTTDSDQRCPICLDDYEPDDSLLKLDGCTHWLHGECLKQWLKSAGTCPVCREPVDQPQNNNSNEPGPSRRRGNPRDDGRGGSRGLGGAGRPGSGDWIPPPWRFEQDE